MKTGYDINRLRKSYYLQSILLLLLVPSPSKAGWTEIAFAATSGIALGTAAYHIAPSHDPLAIAPLLRKLDTLSIDFLHKVGYYKLSEKLIQAVVDGNEELFDADLSRLNVNIPDDAGRTALHWAIIHRRLDMARKLIKYGANANQRMYNRPGQVPLSWAIANGNLEYVQLLVENGANINTYNSPIAPHTPLGQASSISYEMTKYLLSKGASVHPQANAEPPLHCAISARRSDIVQLLLDHEAHIDPTNNGNTPLDTLGWDIYRQINSNLNLNSTLNLYGEGWLNCMKLLLKNHPSLPSQRNKKESGLGNESDAFLAIMRSEKFTEFSRYNALGFRLSKLIYSITLWRSERLLWLAHKKNPNSHIAKLPLELVKVISGYIRSC